MTHYETVFAVTAILAPENVSEVAAKFRKILTDADCKIVHEENWGLMEKGPGRVRGYYRLFEFQALASSVVGMLQTSFKRDERICHHQIARLS